MTDPQYTTRDEILAAIKEAGAMSPLQVREKFNLTASTARYHLRLMRRAGLIETDSASNDPEKMWRPVLDENELENQPIDACIWMDGTLIVKRGESVVLRLKPEETREFREFLVRSQVPTNFPPLDLNWAQK